MMHSIQPHRHSPLGRYRRHRIRRQRPRREGIVLLVVIFVLAMVSAAGGLALRSSRNQSTQAGNNRLAVQTQYLNEAVLLDALAHIELNSPGVIAWRDAPANPAGTFTLFSQFGARDLTGTQTGRTLNALQLNGSRLVGGAVNEAPLWVDPGGGDPTGTTGPGTPWSPTNAVAMGRQDVAVHFLDCRQAPAIPGTAVVPGGALVGGVPARTICSMEARTRSAVAASPIRNNWAIANQTGPYPQLSHAVERLAVGSAIF